MSGISAVPSYASTSNPRRVNSSKSSEILDHPKLDKAYVQENEPNMNDGKRRMLIGDVSNIACRSKNGVTFDTRRLPWRGTQPRSIKTSSMSSTPLMVGVLLSRRLPPVDPPGC